MHGNRGASFPGSFQKHSHSEQVPWTAFSMKTGKHEEPKEDKQISSHCISFTAIYICLWRWKLQNCPGTAISVDHRQWSRYYCRAHIQFMNLSARIAGGFSSLAVRESAAGASRFMWKKLDALPLSQILQVRVMQCEQWAPIGRNINLHLWHGGRNKTLSEPQYGAEVCSVCACRASTFEITNLSEQKTDVNGYFFVWGSVFMMKAVERLRKHSRYILKCTSRALDCDQTIFWECASKNLTWSHLCECMVCAAPKPLLHTASAAEPQHIVAGVRFPWSREERRFQRERFVGRAWFILAASARAWRCEPWTELNGGFGFQTKVKDRFLNQRRWTCWYSCRKKHASPVSDSQFSFIFIFVFVLKSLLSLLFTSSYGMEAFLHFFIIIINLIPQCLLSIL